MEGNGNGRTGNSGENQLGRNMGNDEENDDVQCRTKGEQKEIGENGTKDTQTEEGLKEGANEAEKEDDHQCGADDDADHLKANHL